MKYDTGIAILWAVVGMVLALFWEWIWTGE